MRRIREIDTGIIISAILISIVGLIGIWAARGGPSIYFSRQIIWLIISIIVFFLLALTDYEKLVSWSPWLYGALILLLVVMAKGRGVSSWIRFGSVWFQPSEAGKVIVPLFLTRVLYKKAKFPLSFKDLARALIIVAVPIFLIALQPDLGTAFIYFSFILSAIFIFGMERKYLTIALLAGVSMAVLLWFFMLKDYQKQRIISFLNPSEDPRGSAYQIYQSKISIGSGGLSGKGFKEVSQAKLRFLPAAHTDFIFSVIAESFGFMGVLLLFLLYTIFFLRIFKIGEFLDQEKGLVLLYLISSWIAFQTVFNLLIAVGLFPVTGFPLPLLSYGGSDLVAVYASLGIINSILVWRWK